MIVMNLIGGKRIFSRVSFRDLGYFYDKRTTKFFLWIYDGLGVVIRQKI